MNIDRIATKQEIDFCLSIMELQIKGKRWRDREFCRLAVETYRRKIMSPAPRVHQLSGRWLLLGMALSSSVVVSVLYLIVRLA